MKVRVTRISIFDVDGPAAEREICAGCKNKPPYCHCGGRLAQVPISRICGMMIRLSEDTVGKSLPFEGNLLTYVEHISTIIEKV